jgi:serine/threonine protein kinase/WD40 repeat protein
MDHEVTIFEQALALSSSQEREAYLREACGGDAAMLERLQGLLRAHDLAGQFLEHRSPAAEPGVDHMSENGPAASMSSHELGNPELVAPSKIGRYKILQQIGEGGCGIVYMAEQQEPVRRRVALKIIKPGMDTRQVVARFEAERQALALMDHPSIAKILDGGVTETGRPFFVMDLVQGLPITQFCDETRLPTRARLALFLEVCSAIQHAHQKGVIHRDIKPSNILVTLRPDGLGLPKIIDFGIAKATQQPLTDKTLFTQFQQLIGTPAYMSPEQATLTGFDIDTRSDIYSLGVLLYELLTGKTPFDSKELLQAGVDELRRTIREKEPPRPSTRVSTLPGDELTTTAQRRAVEASKLVSVLRGDLDWIVMKCLEKDRARRYETASGLAMDIQRHLNNEPVLASPPSALYRLQKLARRHKLAFAAAGAVVAALAIGVAVSTFEAVRARQAEREQSRLRSAEAQQKHAAQEFLYDALLGQARATRLARRVGYRDRVFELLKQARALDVPRRNLADLRQEAVASLGDFAGLTPSSFEDFPAGISPWPFPVAALSPSGKLAAFGLRDGSIELREMPSGRQLARFTPTNGPVQSICFSSAGSELFAKCGPPSDMLYGWAPDPDGHWRLTLSRSVPPTTLELFNQGNDLFAVNVRPLDPGVRLEPQKSGKAGALILDAESSGGDVTNGHYGEFRLLDLRTGSFVAGFTVTNELPRGFRLACAATHDAGLLAVATGPPWSPNFSSFVNLYDWRTGRRVNQLHPWRMGPPSLSDDGRYLASLSEVYSVEGLKLLGQLATMDVSLPVVFSQEVAAAPGYSHNYVQLWKLSAMERIASLDAPREGEQPLAFSEAGDALLSAGEHHARLYRLTTPEKQSLPRHTSGVCGVAFSPDGERLASAGFDQVVCVCDSRSGRILWKTDDPLGACTSLSAYSPDGQLLALGHEKTAQISVLDARTGEHRLVFGTNADARTWSVNFSPDGRYLASGTEPFGLQMWTIGRSAAGEATNSLDARLVRSCMVSPISGSGSRAPVQSLSPMSIAFAPDGGSLAFWCDYPDQRYGQGGAVYVWDFGDSTQPREVASPVAPSTDAESFTLDGRALFVFNTNGAVATVEVATGRQIASFPTEDMDIAAARHRLWLSPDGTTLALTRGMFVDIRDSKTGGLIYSLPTGLFTCLAWSPDNRRLALGFPDGGIAIWNLDTVNQILAQVGLSP